MYAEAIKGLNTIKDFIRFAASVLAGGNLSYGHATANYKDEAIALVLAALNLQPDFDQYFWDAVLLSSEKKRIAEFLEKRADKKIPLPYITHEAWFAGLSFYVDERVLVPRSPVAELLNAGFEPWIGGGYPQRILDLCTGSGCIAIACAYYFEGAEIDAVDISEDAIEVAQKNNRQHGTEPFVSIIKSDMFSNLDKNRKYDLIISNPPYVDKPDMDSLPQEFRHEPEIGLTAGDDGLYFARIILEQAKDFLTEDGLLVVEVGNSCEALMREFPQHNFFWPEFENGGHGVFVIKAEDL